MSVTSNRTFERASKLGFKLRLWTFQNSENRVSYINEHIDIKKHSYFTHIILFYNLKLWST